MGGGGRGEGIDLQTKLSEREIDIQVGRFQTVTISTVCFTFLLKYSRP